MNARRSPWLGAVVGSILLFSFSASAATHTVQISDSGDSLKFFPSSIQINVGDTIQWTWACCSVGPPPHSTTSGSCATGQCVAGASNGELWDSGFLNTGATFIHTFTKAGTVSYFCKTHGTQFGMRGAVTVVQPLPPDYSISIPNGSAGPIFPNQSATFNGTLTTQTGFTNSVLLNCGAGAPTPCSVNPSSAVPSSSGTPFTVTLNTATPGTFNFVVHGAGTDAAHTQHSSQPLTLSVANFTVSALSNVTLASNVTSPPQPFTVSGSNFTGVVMLSCTGPGGAALPTGVTCGFSTNPVNLSPGASSVNDSLTLTTSHALQGSYTIMVSATTTSVPNAPTISQSFTLNVKADYRMSISNSPFPVFPGQGGTFTGTITPLDGYTGSVAITCGPFDPAGNSITCMPPAASVPVQGAGPVKFSVSFATNANSQTTAPKDYTASISATDSANGLAHSQPATVSVVDFALAAPNPATVNVAQGNPTPPITLTVSALGQFNSQATLSCSSGLPSGSSCLFSPSATVGFGSGSPGTVNLVINSGGAAVSSGNLVTITATVPPPATANTVHVLVGNLIFNYYSSNPTFGPSSVTVNPSDTVEWDWADTGHTSTSGTCAVGTCTPDSNWDSGMMPLNQGATYRHIFQTPGSFPYFCRVHGPMFGMVGAVQVNTAPPVRAQQLTLNIVAGSGTTNLSVATAHTVKVPAKADPAPVGGTVEFTATVSQTGSAPTNPVLFVAFSEPVTIVSGLPAGCGSVTGGISCPIASFPASPFVFDVVVPFSRSVTAQAFIRSDDANTGSPDQASETVQVRPRPFARQGLPPKLP